MRVVVVVLGWVLPAAVTLAACSQDTAPPIDPDLAGTVSYLSATEHLTRASLALRGVRPSEEELAAVAEDPGYVEAIVDYYLTTPEFGATVREMHGEALLTNVAAYIFPAGFPARGGLSDRSVAEINTALSQAPSRLVEYVVMNDRPYHEIVTADYTLANDIVATVWGLPFDASLAESGADWQVTGFEDGRSVGGLLSDPFVFTRHSSTFSNKNRGRANRISESLLCYDFLSRQVEIDSTIDLADEEAVENAIENNEACRSCHQSLDPLASYFANHFPIFVPSDIAAYPFEQFNPTVGSLLQVTEPGFFGQPAQSVQHLGVRIAEDERFPLCAARRFFGYLGQVDKESVPLELASDLTRALVGSGWNARELAKAVVLSDAFRSSRSSDETEAESLVGVMKVRPEALVRSVEALTGYRWETELNFDFGGTGNIGRVDLMNDPFLGYNVLMGGTDGVSVTRPSHTMSASGIVVVRELARRASEFGVAEDFGQRPAVRRLFRLVEPDTRDEAQVREQLVLLQLRVFGESVAVDDESVDAAFALFESADDETDASRAWSLVLYAMLQDPRFIYY